MALDIDRVRKIFDFAQTVQIPKCISTRRHDKYAEKTRTVWDGCGWRNGEESLSECSDSMMLIPTRG